MPLDLDEVRRIRRSDSLTLAAFDEQYNVDTKVELRPTNDGLGMVASVERNTIILPGSNKYQPSQVEYMDLTNEQLSSIPNIDKYTFVDLGSGKGKVIFNALIKNAPYKNYIGIEGDPYFNNIALNNLESFNVPVTKDVQFLEMNVTDYVAEEKDCVYYLYSSFNFFIFKKFLEKNWPTISKTKSCFVLLDGQQYMFNEFIGKDPIFESNQLSIFTV